MWLYKNKQTNKLTKSCCGQIWSSGHRLPTPDLRHRYLNTQMLIRTWELLHLERVLSSQIPEALPGSLSDTNTGSSQPEFPLPKSWNSTIHEFTHTFIKFDSKKVEQKEMLPELPLGGVQTSELFTFMYRNVRTHWECWLVLFWGNNSLTFSTFSRMNFSKKISEPSVSTHDFPVFPHVPLLPHDTDTILGDFSLGVCFVYF